MTSLNLTLICFSIIFSCHVALASNPTKIDYQPDVKLSLSEVLSMPEENRKIVASAQDSNFSRELEKAVFDANQDFSIRWKSLTLFAQLQKEKSEAVLQKALTSKEWFLRNAALLAYDQVLPQKSISVATKMLSDKALVVRSAAVKVLAKKMDPNLRETFWAELNQKRNFRKNQGLFIRGQILDVLSQNPQKSESPLFAQLLQESDVRLHQPAINALEQLTSKKMGAKADTLDQKRTKWLSWAEENKQKLIE